MARYQNADTHPLQAKSVSSVDVGMPSIDRHVNTRASRYESPGMMRVWLVREYNISIFDLPILEGVYIRYHEELVP